MEMAGDVVSDRFYCPIYHSSNIFIAFFKVLTGNTKALLVVLTTLLNNHEVNEYSPDTQVPLKRRAL
jgi:hypothetical protein